jgi:hypothetical protein
VLKNNRRIEYIYISLTVILFLCGIAGIIKALVSGQLLWSIPPVFTTAFLHYPLTAIKDFRQKNIALATAPALISLLPTDKAAEQMQKLIQQLYGEK